MFRLTTEVNFAASDDRLAPDMHALVVLVGHEEPASDPLVHEKSFLAQLTLVKRSNDKGFEIKTYEKIQWHKMG